MDVNKRTTDTYPSSVACVAPETPLIELDPKELELVARAVPGGLANVNDIYPLTPQQEGMLLQHVMRGEGDTYMTLMLFECRSRCAVRALVHGLQLAIDRHEALRSAILWHGLCQPVQVVYRSARLQLGRLPLDPTRNRFAQVLDRMRPELHRLNLTRAPLMRLQVTRAGSTDGVSYALLLLHHLFCDAISMETLLADVAAHIRGDAAQLPTPQRFRDHVAQTLNRKSRDAEVFFSAMLGDFTTPSVPFGLASQSGQQGQVHELRQKLPSALAQRLRSQARALRVSTAAIFHVACALAIGHMSQRNDVVFGSVFAGRLQSGLSTRRTIGMFINTLPLRLRLDCTAISEAVSRMHRQLLQMLAYEQIDLTVAQRCSGVPRTEQLFAALLNYIRRPQERDLGGAGSDLGLSLVACRAWTNYPFTFIVEDLGEDFEVVSQTWRSAHAQQTLDCLIEATRSIVEALTDAPSSGLASLSVFAQHEPNRRPQPVIPMEHTPSLCPDVPTKPVEAPQFESPQGPTEECLAEIWSQVLNVEPVGRNQSFFSLGGHSLMSLKLLLKVSERFGVQMPAIPIFRYPTVRQMAELLDGLMSAAISKDADSSDMEEGVI